MGRKKIPNRIAKCRNSPICLNPTDRPGQACPSCRELMALLARIHSDRGDDCGIAGEYGCPVDFDTARREELHRARAGGI